MHGKDVGVRPFGGTKLATMGLLVALALGTGAATAGAGVRAHGGNGGHPVDARCKQPSHRTKWFCQPPTTTATTSTTMTTLGPASPPPSTVPPSVPTSPAPALVADDDGESFVALAPLSGSPPPAVIPELPPFTDVPGFELPGLDNLLDEGPGGVPLAVAVAIAAAGLATIVLVLRGTFGRGAPLPVADDGESLKFR